MFHSIQEIFQNKSLVLKNRGILSTEMLEGFYFETGNQKFQIKHTYLHFFLCPGHVTQIQTLKL